ncbi:hypothetical protein V5799_027911 [Amblyomma americanum]|uniref:M13 family peptidase n=1 Tax=Amblyomma americanum TaxID=6943 RepID=A0AAQ4DED0_AMBAM
MMAFLIAFVVITGFVNRPHLKEKREFMLAVPQPNYTAGVDDNVFNDTSLDKNEQGPCDERETTYAALMIANTINITADPCSDFYSYVCSGYERIARVPLLSELENNVTKAIYRHFMRSTRMVEKEQPEALLKAVAYYRSCLKPIHISGNTHILATLFKELDLSFNTKITGFLETTLELLLNYGLQIFFTLMVDPYPRFGETVSYVYFGASRPFEEWKKTRKTLFDEGMYAQIAKEVILATGFDGNGTSLLIREIWYVESMLIEGNRVLKNKPDMRKLEAKWKRLLNYYSRGTLMGQYKLSMRSKAVSFFNRMLFNTNEVQHSVYITWEVARHLASVSGFIKFGRPLDRRAYCYDLSYSIYGPAISAPVLLPLVNSSRLAQVRRMVRTLASEIYTSIKDSDWIMEETTAKLTRKLRLVTWRLGYDIGLANWSGLNNYYRGYPLATGVFIADYANTNEAQALNFFYTLRKRGKGVEFSFRSDVVGAFYEGPNALVVPAATMLSPLFSFGGPPELNYGLLGSVVLQNLMRAFGHNNMLDDGTGAKVTWIPEERAEFEDRYHCDRTSKVADSAVDPLPGMSVGAQSLFRAYRRAAATRRGHSCTLPALRSLSSDQQFFVGRCLLHCRDIPVEDSLPEDHTCNLIARHSAEFATAFQCPTERTKVLCDMW